MPQPRTPQLDADTDLLARAFEPEPSAGPGANADEPLFSLTPLKQWGGFTKRALKRHRLVAAIAFVIGVLLGGMALLGSPPQYQTSMTILLRNQNFGTGFEVDDRATVDLAGRLASEIILRRDSLDEMIDELGLLDTEVDPPIFGRLSESIFETIFGTPTEADRREAKRNELRAAIVITQSSAGESLFVAVTWPDPDQAVAIADYTFTIFYDEREIAELAPVEAAVSILSASAQEATAEVTQLREALGLDERDGAPGGSALEAAVVNEQELVSRLRSAQLDLDQARAGLQYRYTVLEAPTEPLALGGQLTNIVAVLIFATIIAAGVCLVLDTRHRVLIEPWQLEKLGIRPLAQITPPST